MERGKDHLAVEMDQRKDDLLRDKPCHWRELSDNWNWPSRAPWGGQGRQKGPRKLLPQDQPAPPPSCAPKPPSL